MATYSFADLKDLALPSLWDLGTLKQVQLADGKTFDEVVRDILDALRLVNGEILDMPHYSGAIAVQDDMEVEYPVGVVNGVEDASEYAAPVPGRGATTGHMIPEKEYVRALGWTMMYLRKARMKKLDADVRAAMNDLRDHWQKAILTRFFKMEGETVGATSNASVPFADGGVVDSTYVPPNSPEGEAFLYTHDHYLRHSALNDTNLAITIEHLQEHGHQSPFEVIGSRADAATWKAVTGWKAPEWAEIVYRAATDRAAIPQISEYFGYVETAYGVARVWLTPRVPTAYYGAFKSYGPGDLRNPLRVRFGNTLGFGWNLIPGNWVNAPTMMAVLMSAFGVGVGEDRTNGMCVEIDSGGDYATPTIS